MFKLYTSNQKVAPLYKKKCITVFFCPLLLQMAFFSFFILLFTTPEYEEGKEGHLEQKRAKEDSDALFLRQRSHFLVTSVGAEGKKTHNIRRVLYVWLCLHHKFRNYTLIRNQFTGP